MKEKRKVLIGASLFNWSETQRMCYIAEKLIDRGFEIMFLGEGKYDYLVDELSVIRKVIPEDQKWFVQSRIDKMLNLDLYGNDYATYEEIDEVVTKEAQIMEEYQPDFVITGYRTTFSVSTRIQKIPLVWCLSAVVSPMFFQKGLATIPEDVKMNHFLSNIKDQSQKQQYFAKFAAMNALSNNKTSKAWNQCLKKHGLPELKSDISIFQGDINFMTDAKELFQELKEPNPSYEFSGPFRPRDELMELPEWFKTYQKKNRKVILVMLGSSGTKEILHKVLQDLIGAPYDFFVSTLSKLSKEEEDSYPEHFYFANKFPIRTILDYVDGCVIHGGQGTMYSVAFSGKPFVGVPMFNEQQYNLNNMVKKLQNGIVVLKHNIKDGELVKAVDRIIKDDSFLQRALHAKEVLRKYAEDETTFAETVIADQLVDYLEVKRREE